MPDDVFSMVWGREWYIRVRPPWSAPADGARQSALDLGGATGGDTGGATGGDTGGAVEAADTTAGRP
jgi:hypothetical protein